MTALKVRRSHFSGGSNLVDGQGNSPSLSQLIRGVAIDMARDRFDDATFVALTDNSGGANQSGGMPALAIPSTNFDATSAGGSTRTSLNAAILTHADAQAQLAEHINDLRAPLGLSMISGANVGHSSNTINAVTASTSAGSGTGVSTRTSIAAAFTAIRNNWATLARAANEVAAALDVTRLTDNSGGTADYSLVTAAIPATVASTSGADSVSKTNVDAFLAASQNAVKTLSTYVHTVEQTTRDNLRVLAAD